MKLTRYRALADSWWGDPPHAFARLESHGGQDYFVLLSCPYCRRQHVHSFTNDGFVQHRAAHCLVSPRLGYIIVAVRPAVVH